MDNKLVLGYWNIRGLAQPIRFLLNLVGLEYEEVLYDETTADKWFKVDSPAFNHPFANLPYLKDGDQAVFESDAIHYYIAHKANRADLLGKDAQQQIQVATLRGVIGDFRSLLMPILYDQQKFDEAKTQKFAEVGGYFEVFDTLLKTRNFITGDTVTYVDFTLWEYIDEFLVLYPELLTNLVNLQEYHKKIQNIPEIAKFIASPKYMARPFNGTTAAFR